jgi:hypothetical protein
LAATVASVCERRSCGICVILRLQYGFYCIVFAASLWPCGDDLEKTGVAGHDHYMCSTAFSGAAIRPANGR